MMIEIRVPLARFARGSYTEAGDKIDEGDIKAAYSADTIAMTGKIRRPFQYQGQAYTATGGCGDETEAYKLADPTHFKRSITSYREKTRDGHAARADPFGFYDGMLVKQGGRSFVLAGPPVRFIGDSDLRDKAVQLSLFG